MPNIKPVSDLRNYYDVLSEVQKDAPVFLTKNGRGTYAIITIDEYEDYERYKAISSLRNELIKTIRRDEVEGVLSEEEALKAVGLKKIE